MEHLKFVLSNSLSGQSRTNKTNWGGLDQSNQMVESFLRSLSWLSDVCDGVCVSVWVDVRVLVCGGGLVCSVCVCKCVFECVLCVC